MFEHQSDDSDVTWWRGRGPRLRAVARALLVLLARGHEQDLFLMLSIFQKKLLDMFLILGQI